MRHTTFLFAFTLMATVLAEQTSAFQIEQPRDTIRKEIKFEHRDGTVISVYVDEAGRVIIEGLELDDEALSVSALRRALEPRDRRARAFTFRGEMPDPGILAHRLGERFRARVHDDPISIDLDDLRIHHPMLGIRDYSPALRLFAPENAESLREIADLEREVRQLGRQAREAEGAERARYEEELDQRLTQLFDRRHQLRQSRLERLQEEVSQERQELADRERNRREIIERRKRELLGERDRLEW